MLLVLCVSTDGIKFFWSENDVLLTAGDAEGKIQPKYFSRALKLRPSSKKTSYTEIKVSILCLRGFGFTISLFTELSFAVFQGASCHCSNSRECCPVIGHYRTHLTMLASDGWLMLIPVPLATHVFQQHRFISNRSAYSEISQSGT